jgi:glycosyltransferase involved in cell wall biosynthesis
MQKKQTKILVTLENFEYGGTTTHLINLINNKAFNNTFFFILTNKNNKSINQILDECNKKKIKIIYYKSLNALKIKNLILKVLFYIFKPIFFLFSIIQITLIMRRVKFDLLLADCGGYGDFRTEMASIFAGKLLGKKNLFILIHHCYTRPLIWSSIINVLNLLISKYSSHIIFVSNATKNSMQKNTQLLYYSKKISVIHNGIQLKKFKKKKLKIFKIDKKLYTVGMLARIESYKGQIDLVEGFNNLPPQFKKKYKIFFIGSGSDFEIQKLNNLIKTYKLTNHIKRIDFINENSLTILNNFDIFFSLTKDFEGFGYSIAEALYALTPVVSTKVGGVTEFLNNKNSTLINSGDINSITEFLKKFLVSKKFFKKKSIIGKKNIEKKFNSNIMSKKYKDCFKKYSQEKF